MYNYFLLLIILLNLAVVKTKMYMSLTRIELGVNEQLI